MTNNPEDHLISSITPTVPKPVAEKVSSSSNRSSKKDRHSKIKTAKGLRDRRMRLSLDVAKRFFDLQDMLGFDKASHTVNWLLKNSLQAITDLKWERLGANYTSSTNSENQNSDREGVSLGLDALSGTWEKEIATVKVKKVKKARAKAAVRATVEKESRKKSRERARARASQKRQLLGDDCRSSMVRLESSEGDDIFGSSSSAPSNPSATAGFLAHPPGFTRQRTDTLRKQNEATDWCCI